MADPATIAAAASAGINAVNGLYNIFGGSNHRRYKYAKRLMEATAVTNDYYNTKYWNMQNAYNSPTAQAARLRQAGFNPAIMAENYQPMQSGTPQSNVVASEFSDSVGEGFQQLSEAPLKYFSMRSAMEDIKSKQIANKKAASESEYFDMNARLQYLRMQAEYNMIQRQF